MITFNKPNNTTSSSSLINSGIQCSKDDLNKLQSDKINKDYSARLDSLEKFVNRAIKQKNPPCTKKRANEYGFSYTPTAFARLYFIQLNSFIKLYSDHIIYTPKIDLFFSICKELDLFDLGFIHPQHICRNRMVAAESFNQLVKRIQEVAKKQDFKRKLYRFEEGRRRQFKSLTTYVNSLFDNRRSRLIVVRVDLRYKADNGPTMRSNQAKLDMCHLLSNMRSKSLLFGDLEGYIWKLECGCDGADHFHCIFFFNNDHHQKDDWLGEQIGKYWEEVITQGRGCYFNCNRPAYKAKQRFLGIGRIEANDLAKRENLQIVVAYLCKSEQQIKAKTTKRYRTIGKGEMPEVRSIRPGAPRTVSV